MESQRLEISVWSDIGPLWISRIFGSTNARRNSAQFYLESCQQTLEFHSESSYNTEAAAGAKTLRGKYRGSRSRFPPWVCILRMLGSTRNEGRWIRFLKSVPPLPDPIRHVCGGEK